VSSGPPVPILPVPRPASDLADAGLAHGKSLKQVQGWLRHSQLTTTMNVYIHQVDDGLGDADAWDDILTPRTVGETAR
jgi:integrase